MIDFQDTAYLLQDWSESNSLEWLAGYLPFAGWSNFIAAVHSPRGQTIHEQTAKLYLKAFTNALKDIGRHGGNPVKLKQSCELLQDVIDELKCALS